MIRVMKYSIEISKIIEGAIKNDRKKIINYSNLLIEKLKSDNEIRFADKISNLLSKNGVGTLNSMDNKLKNTPVDSESRFSMIEIYYPEDFNDELVISDQISNQINMFIKNYEQSDELASAGLESANKLLLYGPPGSGKTKTAYHIANKLNIPLVIGRLDSIISSYLGTTAKNIRTLFEFAESTPCVLLLDEFDAIAKARDDSNELGELKRVVNSLLQNIDILDSNSILIAATNHEQLLDTAIWRRFDYKIFMDYPSSSEIKKMISIFTNRESLTSKEISVLAAMFAGKSGADIELVIKKARRNAIINSTDFTYKLIISEFLDIHFQGTNIDNEKIFVNKAVIYLRNIEPKIFTYDLISELLGVSKTTISKIIKEVNADEQ